MSWLVTEASSQAYFVFISDVVCQWINTIYLVHCWCHVLSFLVADDTRLCKWWKWIRNYQWLQMTEGKWQLKSSVQNFSVSSCLLFLWSYVVIGIHNLMHLSSSIQNELFANHELPLQINNLFMNYKIAHVQLIHTLHLLAHVMLSKNKNIKFNTILFYALY